MRAAYTWCRILDAVLSNGTMCSAPRCSSAGDVLAWAIHQHVSMNWSASAGPLRDGGPRRLDDGVHHHASPRGQPDIRSRTPPEAGGLPRPAPPSRSERVRRAGRGAAERTIREVGHPVHPSRQPGGHDAAWGAACRRCGAAGRRAHRRDHHGRAHGNRDPTSSRRSTIFADLWTRPATA